ncbi:Replicase polyprotein 1ab [Plantactinospora sp. KLBMP9567]|nr:Replicase polyprotein 1ab [Plantactinospora sp. KLBMP9567]MDW5330463.1 Replicase polyprotein 1ab [Plantactinospora sp. KLBMP9567]
MARHLVATGTLIDDDPNLALEHALAARRLAARISSVREAVGLAAYRAGEWQTAIAELRTYHRMSGRQTHLAVLADCERALGRPERAIDLYRGADRESLDQAGAVELLIVAAGARADMGQGDAAVAMLQVRELTAVPAEPWAARLRYAYADALLGVDRREEAREWFVRAAEVDEFGETDAAERLLELDGVVLEGDEDEDDDTADGESDRVADADAAAPDDGSAERDGEPEGDDEYDDEVARADRDEDEDEDEYDDEVAQPVGEAGLADEDPPTVAAETTPVGADTAARGDADAMVDANANANVDANADVNAKADEDEDEDAEAGPGDLDGPDGEPVAAESADAETPAAEAAAADPGARPVRGAES